MNATNTSAEDALYIESMSLLRNIKNGYFAEFFSGLLAVMTNPLIIWTIWKHKSLHTGCFTLIAQLALADFLYGLSYVIFMTKCFIRLGFGLGEVISQFQCFAELASTIFSETASLTLALAVGFERLLAAAKPIEFNIYEWKLTRLISIVAWLIPTLECCTMLIVVLRSSFKLLTLCTPSYAVTPEYFAMEQIGKICLAVAIVVVYFLSLIALTLQLAVAKRRGQQALKEMKKNVQVKMAYLVVGLAVAYLILQVATRILLAVFANVPPAVLLNIAPPLRTLTIVNSGIHLFVYLSTSSVFREAFVLSFGIKTIFKGGSSSNQVKPL